MDVPVIETERMVLRGFEADDFPAYRAYYTGNRTGGVGGPLPEYQVFERFCSMIGHWQIRGFGRFAVADRAGGAAFGHVGPMQLVGTEIEMTWTLWDANREGQGLATEAGRAAVDYCSAQGMARMVAFIEADNTPSIRVAERLGAVLDETHPGRPGMRDGKVYVFDGGTA